MQQKINYLITGVMVLLVVILGVYYYKTKPKPSPFPGIGENSQTPNSPLEESPQSGGGGISTPSSTESTPQEGNFNTTMDNARKALNNKDYSHAITYYKQALTYKNTDTPYSGLFIVYGAQGDWVNAQKALDIAIQINPSFVDYWVSKLTVMDEKTAATYLELKNVYNEGLSKVDPKRKIDLVTFFATVAENNGQIADAIAAWTEAIQVYPQNKLIYQGEIDRIKSN